jgi:hypothetical protein
MVAAGCGSERHATRLRIEVADATGVRAYALRCGPARGTAPRPDRICAYLRENPSLLVGGPELDHSCPAQPGRIFRVSGTYRGHPIDATFASTACGFVPGQRGGWADWTFLMAGAGPGTREQALASAPVDRAKRREQVRRAKRLRRDLRRLKRRRGQLIANGTLEMVPGSPPDSLTRLILREELEMESLLEGTSPGQVRLYSTAGGPKERSDQPVYVVVVRYAYRDYTGRKHVDPTALAATMEARTLQTTDVAWGAPWNPAGMGRPIELEL